MARTRVDWRRPGIYGDQPLWEEAAALRAQGSTWQAIADDLRKRYGVNVTQGTVMKAVQKAREDEGGHLSPPETASGLTPPVSGGRGGNGNGDGNGGDGEPLEGPHEEAGEAPAVQYHTPAAAPLPDPELVTRLDELRDDPAAHEEFAREVEGRLRRYDRGVGLEAGPTNDGGNGHDEQCEIFLRIPGRIEFRAWGDSPDDLREAMGEAETILGGVTE